MTAGVVELSIGEARRVAISASGLAVGLPSVDAALQYLGIVQLDTINAVARAHELTLASRVGGLTTTGVDRVLWGDPAEPVAFEYCAHAAALVPITDWPLWEFRRCHTRNRDIDWRPEPADQARMIKTITAEGPLTMRQLRGNEQASDGWNWSPTKTAIEYLVWTGELACVRRDKWNRIFDIPERVIGGHLLDQQVDDHTALIALLSKAARVLGAATVDDLADYLRISRVQANAVLPDTALQRVTVPGWKQATWAHPEALAGLVGDDEPVTRFLGPFDNLIWYRKRLARLFDFDHALEAYKPVAKRLYGYYALPLLSGTRLVGRADIKADGDALHLLRLTGDRDREVPTADLDDALEHLMQLTGTSSIHR